MAKKSMKSATPSPRVSPSPRTYAWSPAPAATGWKKPPPPYTASGVWTIGGPAKGGEKWARSNNVSPSPLDQLDFSARAYNPAMLHRNAIAPVVWALAVIGVMPLALRSRVARGARGWGCRPRSTLPWCLLLYSAVLLSGLALVRDQIPTLLGPDLDLDTRMVSTELIFHLLPLLYVPCIWWQSRDICLMTISYGKTKKLIQTVTMSNWRRDARRRRVYAVVTGVMVVLCVAFVVGAYTLVDKLHLRPAHLPVLLYTMVVQTLVALNVVIQLLQLLILARSVRNGFAQAAPAAAAMEAPAAARTVRAYRELWVELRELFGYDDSPCHVVYVLNMLYLLCQCTMVSFEAFSFYVAGDRWASIGHGVFATVYFAEIYLLCECAHRAVAVMKEPFVTILDRMSLGQLDQDTYHEVCFFYNTIIAQAPSYSIRGYASLDRPYLASIIMAIASYLVFLAQCRSQVDSVRAVGPV